MALARDGQLVDETTGDPTLTHGQRLPGDLQSLLARHDVTTDAVDRYAVAAGPGSFTGLRVGIATIQGLALAHDKRVVAISVLDTLVEIAAQLADRGRPRTGPHCPVGERQTRRGFRRPLPTSTLHGCRRHPTAGRQPRRTAGDRWRVTVEPVAVPPVALLDTWADTLATRRVWVIGDGVAAYQSVLADRLGAGSRTIHETPPLAGVMAGHGLGRTVVSAGGRAARASSGLCPSAGCGVGSRTAPAARRRRWLVVLKDLSPYGTVPAWKAGSVPQYETGHQIDTAYQGGGMAIESQQLKEHLLQTDHGFRQLVEQHQNSIPASTNLPISTISPSRNRPKRSP